MVQDLRRTAEESAYGLPSEPPNSPYYVTDGYGRGPIWAPSTMIVAEGLDDLGEHDLEQAARRCQLLVEVIEQLRVHASPSFDGGGV